MYVLLEEARALKLIKGAHIKIGWVSCRVRRKKEVNRCFRCLGFGHIAAGCRGTDCSWCCCRCGEEGQLRVPAPGSRGASSVPQERKSPGITTSQGPGVARLFGRQLLMGSLGKAAMGRRTGGARPEIKTKKRGGEF